MKLWDKGIEINKRIESFTIGKDREMDVLLAPYDILGSLAHAAMLKEVGLLTESDYQAIRRELICLYAVVEKTGIIIEEGVEDVHSQVELYLTRKLGEAGKRIHTARSRNDQVLLDIKLFIRSEIHQIVSLTQGFFNTLQLQSEKNRDIILPGYTHLQVAMPSSFGLWFGAYAESLVDDMLMLQAAYRVNNQNPLGSAAGYGSSFPIKRQITTDLLGFDSMNYNVVYAQMGRGKIERTVAFALSSLASTISKMAYDVCLFASQNFGFLRLPDAYTTGSSIMPHKKNPDVFELLRAKCNKIQSLPDLIGYIINNLPSGYFRDLQIIKESFLPAFDEIKECLVIADFAVDKLEVSKNIVEKDQYKYLFSVEEVNKRVEQGVPFRDAYKQIASEIQSGTFNPDMKLNHTHEGSLGNLCNEDIARRMQKIIGDFNFQKANQALKSLLHDG
jgi:argininosuccinate lyase